MTELDVKFNSEEKDPGCPELNGNTAMEQEICLKDVDPLQIDERGAAPDPAADPLTHEKVLENATKEAEIANDGSTSIPSCVNMKITKDLDSVESTKSDRKIRDDNPSISCDNGTKDKLSHNNNILNNNLDKTSNESLQNGTSSKKTLETLTSNTTMNIQQTSKDMGIAKSSTSSVVKEASPEDKEVEGCSQNVSEQKMETLFSKSPINLDEIEFDNGATEDDADCKLDSRDEDELLLSPDENEKPAAGFKSQNGDIQHATNAEPRKKRSEESELETPVKKLCQEVEKAFPNHDNMINDYIISATKNNVDEIQRHTEQLLSEIQTLRELAQKKELEWNNILHLKKVKEEILLRLLRRKQVLSFEKTSEINQVTDGQSNEINFDFLMQPKGYAIDRNDEVSGLAIKQPVSNVNRLPNCNTNSNNNIMMLPINTGSYGPLSIIPPPYTERPMTSVASNLPKQILPKPVVILPNQKMPMYPCELNEQLQAHLNQPMGRQGPIKDVKSIIADYRQRHPEIVPRRGRRMKSILNPQAIGNPRPMAPQMDQRIADLSYLMNNVDANQKSILEKLHGQTSAAMANGIAFKDVLVHWQNSFAQPQSAQLVPQPSAGMGLLTTKSEKLPPPPPYPEISLHPVVSSATENSSCQQPISQAGSLLHGILTKNCGEITITPVQPSPTPQVAEKQTEEVVQLDDEESGGDETEPDAEGAEERRLVIDEGGDTAADGEVPNCQGCKRRHAQFVCAGCANQWYCSRECQVAAWDEHSEMCSG